MGWRAATVVDFSNFNLETHAGSKALKKALAHVEEMSAHGVFDIRYTLTLMRAFIFYLTRCRVYFWLYFQSGNGLSKIQKLFDVAIFYLWLSRRLPPSCKCAGKVCYLPITSSLWLVGVQRARNACIAYYLVLSFEAKPNSNNQLNPQGGK